MKAWALRKRGFTLVELLVVIGLITVILTVLSFSLQGGGQGVGLQNAQAICSSMVSAARAKAALTGRDARLVFVADDTAGGKYLRCLAVIHQDELGNWVQSDDVVYLPSGICIVPPGTVPVVDGVEWGTAEKSAFTGPNAVMSVTIDGESMDCWYVSFTSRGTITGTGIQIVLSTTRAEADGFAFENPASMRGLRVSSYGVQTLISDADGFPTS